MSAPAKDGACLVAIVAYVLSFPSGAVRALVAMKGWEWFVADTFGAPTLGFVEAWGLFLLISFATLHPDLTDDDTAPGVLMFRGFFLSLLLSALMFLSFLLLASIR